jgi:two-component system response regulator HydG
VAATDAHVLLTGESGSGKELAARAIHERSGRHAGPWVPVNCAAIPETLVESELFGHSQGAFTDASHARLGLLLQADGGTLFLDEVGELPYAVQSKFLRLLEDHVVRPLGGTSDVPCSIRIVAATNRCLPDMVRDGQFRADLYHRLHVIGIHVPPLRHRLDDIPDLAQFFLEQTCIRWNRPIPPVSAALLERFCHYRWPGNVRELRNVIEHAVALSLGHEELSFEHMPSRWLTDAASVNDVLPPATSGAPRLDHMTHAHILKVLETTGGNRSEAARVLGIDRATLYRKLNKMSSREAQNRAK